MDYSKSAAAKLVSLVVLLTLVGAIGSTHADQVMRIEPVSVTAIVPDTSVVVPPPSTGGGSSGGGGGGGGSYPSAPAADTIAESVIFRGIAYPGSIVTLFKNGVTVAEQPTSPDATFEIIVKGLRTGTYLFGLRGQDNQGNQSVLSTYTIYVTEGVTTVVKGIFIAPTLSIDKRQVKRGDPLTVIGKSTQNAEVTVVFNSETNLVKKTTVDTNGNWFYKLDTLELDYGDHQVKARASANSDFTPFSQSLSFKVGTQSIVNDAHAAYSIYDINTDGKVNLIDFSLLVYWYRRTNPPKKVDFNNDGKVNLIDFSLLVYNWTG